MIYKLILISLLCIINLYAQGNLRIGVLAYGTVNWELDVLKQNNLDKLFVFLVARRIAHIGLLKASLS